MGVLESGRRCTEVIVDRVDVGDGWIAIEPEGFVRLGDLVLLQQDPSQGSLLIDGTSKITPRRLSSGALHSRPVQPGSRRMSTASSISSISEPDAALALRAEQVRIREANVGLREEGVEVASSLERARQEKERIYREIETLQNERLQLQQERLQEQEDLERCKLVKGRMQEKLVRCQQVVATTVSNMDIIYDGSADEAREAAVAASIGAWEAGQLLETLDEEEQVDGGELAALQSYSPRSVEDTSVASTGTGPASFAAMVGKENDDAASAAPSLKRTGGARSPLATAEKNSERAQQSSRVFGGSTHNVVVGAPES